VTEPGANAGAPLGVPSPDAQKPQTTAHFDPELCGLSSPLEALTFEEIVGSLEAVTNRLANGELGIEAAADLYEQAEILYEAAEQRLAAVEARISRLQARQ